MKTRSLGIAFAALLACAPVRGSAEDAVSPAARKHDRRYAYWEPFPIYWPSYHRHNLSLRRVAWFNWF